MNRRETGFVLMCVLVFMQLLAILGLYALTSVKNRTRLMRGEWNSASAQLSANSILRKIELISPDDPLACDRPVTSSAVSANLPLSWWKTYGCPAAGETSKVYFIREYLGLAACAKIKLPDNSLIAANYYRITLYYSLTEASSAIVLQSTVAFPGRTQPVCSSQEHEIFSGRQMVRELR